MATASLTSTYLFLSGSRTECQLENPRERQRQLHLLHDCLQSSTEAILVASPDDKTIVSQIILSLTSIRALISGLSPSHLLETERALKNLGESDPTRLKPAGLVVVLAEEWAPVTTTIMPVAAALAAGCQSLLVLPPEVRSDDKIWGVLATNILYKVIDNGGFGVCTYSDLHNSLLGDNLFQFDAVVSQRTRAASEIVDLLASCQLHGLRILESCRGGTAAAIVSRSYGSSLEAVATAVIDAVTCIPQGRSLNASQFPRVLLVDEFVVDKLVQEMEKALSGRVKLQSAEGGKAHSIEQLPIVRLQGDDGNLVTANEIRTAVSGISENDSTILIVSTTSLDDAIDRLNHLNVQAEAPIVYHFAANDEAAYLSQFINAQRNIIGGIPIIAQLINPPTDRVGLARDLDHQLLERACLGLLYSVEQFSKCRPVFNCLNSRLGSSLFATELQSAPCLPKEVKRKLGPLNQRKGGHVSYFTQGLIVSLAVVVLPVIGMTGFGGWRFVSRLLR